MGEPCVPGKSPGPLCGHQDPCAWHPLRTIEFVPIPVTDDQTTGPFRLTMPSFGTPGTDPLNRPLVPAYHLRSPVLPGYGGGMVRARGPEGTGAWHFDPIRRHYDVESGYRLGSMDLASLGLGAGVWLPTPGLNLWINKPGGNRPPKEASPPYRLITDPNLRNAIVNTLNAARKLAPAPAAGSTTSTGQTTPPSPPAPTPAPAQPAADPTISADIEIHLQVQLFFGFQSVKHTKYEPSVPGTGTSYEQQFIGGLNITLQCHDDTHSGWEFQLQVQGSKDVGFNDPSLTGDAAKQPAPWAVQGSASVSYVIVVSQTLSIVMQVQGSFGWSSQFDDTHIGGTKQYGISVSSGLQWKLSDSWTLGASLQGGETYQPETSGRLTGDDMTRDVTLQFTASLDLGNVAKALAGLLKGKK